MGRVKEYYHDTIIAEQEQHDADMEEAFIHHDIERVAELVANDEELFEHLMKRIFHYRKPVRDDRQMELPFDEKPF